MSGSPAVFDCGSSAQRFGELRSQWSLIEAAERKGEAWLLHEWGRRLEYMRQLETILRREGSWRRGPADLMSVLRYGYDEVRHCRVLGWLLDPIGTHGLDSSFLCRFLSDLNAALVEPVDFADPERATVSLEEGRDGSRADLIIRGPGWMVVIEAKVLAPRNSRQLEGTTERWKAGGQVTFVFLSRRAVELDRVNGHQWVPYRWAELTNHLDDCLAQPANGPPAAGRPAAVEYLRTMRRYLG